MHLMSITITKSAEDKFLTELITNRVVTFVEKDNEVEAREVAARMKLHYHYPILFNDLTEVPEAVVVSEALVVYRPSFAMVKYQPYLYV